MEISHCEQFCDSGLAFLQDKHRQNSFAILALVAFDLVAALASQAYVERAFSVYSDTCASKHNRMSIIFTTESYSKYKAGTACFSQMNKKYLAIVLL